MIHQNKGTIEYPQVGDIRSGKEIGNKIVGKLIFSPCIVCERGRWVQIVKNKPCHSICFFCAMKSLHHRNAVSMAMKNNHNRLGKNHSEATIHKIAIAMPGRKGKENGFYGKTHTLESKAKNRASNISTWSNVKLRDRTSKIHKELWENPEYYEKAMRAILKANHKRPTSYEQKIIDLIKEYNLSFRYTGNGQVIIGHKNPDFVNTNGQKVLIETYGAFWHKPSYEKERAKIFADYGYKTIFLNDHDLCCSGWKEKCLSKLEEMLYEPRL